MRAILASVALALVLLGPTLAEAAECGPSDDCTSGCTCPSGTSCGTAGFCLSTSQGCTQTGCPSGQFCDAQSNTCMNETQGCMTTPCRTGFACNPDTNMCVLPQDCPMGTVACGVVCIDATRVCCDTVGHPELSCPAGNVCTNDGRCIQNTPPPPPPPPPPPQEPGGPIGGPGSACGGYIQCSEVNCCNAKSPVCCDDGTCAATQADCAGDAAPAKSGCSSVPASRSDPGRPDGLAATGLGALLAVGLTLGLRRRGRSRRR